MFQIGDTIREYRLEGFVGRGGMASVWRVRHTLLDQIRAMKVMAQNLAAEEGFSERFRAEAVNMGRLAHPGILGVLEFFVERGQHCIVMPFVDGESLETLLRRTGPLEGRELLVYALPILEALDYAHERGLVHRDVKPSNILLDRSGHILLADFGISLMLGEDRKTRTGASLGTPHYMSPEQIFRPRLVDRRSDVYALGCVFYEMLAGRPPFVREEGESTETVMLKHETRPVEPLARWRPGIPPALEGTILRALTKKPEDRHPTCRDFGRALAQAVAAAASGPPASTGITVPNRPGLAVSTAPAVGIPFPDRAGPFTPPAGLGTPPPPPGPPRFSPPPAVQTCGQPAPGRPPGRAGVATRPGATASGAPPVKRWPLPLLGVLAAVLAAGLIVLGYFLFRSAAERVLPPAAGPARSGATSPAKGGEGQTLPTGAPAALPHLRNSLGMEFVRIPPGVFVMGSAAETNEQPPHPVKIAASFCLQTAEVNVEQFRLFTRKTGYRTEAEVQGVAYAAKGNNWIVTKGISWLAPTFPIADRDPVVCVSWNDAQAFCTWLSQTDGRRYRLPTEAEWEYACRAGGAGGAPAGLSGDRVDAFAWYTGNAGNRTHVAGSLQPNAWGLYDMLGNAWEWCEDWYADDYRAVPGGVNPRGPIKGDRRVIRGAGWADEAKEMRSANRWGLKPSDASIDLGFRVVLE